MPSKLVGARIRERRQALKLKQADVAQAAGISPSYLNLIEHNRRGIAGKVLIALAGVLGLEVSELLEGADSDLIQAVQTAAGAADVPVELARTEAFVSQYPGWARLIARLEADKRRLGQVVDSLSDRLTHDPFLSESLHEILSSVTAIHATADILSRGHDMEGLQQRRFQGNIFDESARLSELSRGLVSYFDRQAESQLSLSTPLDEVEALLAAASFHFSELENAAADTVEDIITALLRASPAITTTAAFQMAGNVLALFAEDCQRLPLAEFLTAARHCDFAPRELAHAFGVSPDMIYRRLAFLPEGQELPQFGLIVCDGTGAVLLRKPLPGFTLPRYGSACALWPLYRSMSRPHAPMEAVLRTPADESFLAEAFSSYLDISTSPALRSAMLFRATRPDEDLSYLEQTRIGPSCRICVRTRCLARREPSIHAENAEIPGPLAKPGGPGP
jgi:XRE family transcriptional regulator, fatty acid utilization regulator